jgi:sugar O-acyltransferase (sialic acid O-acetyltransferase NeuD family)
MKRVVIFGAHKFAELIYCYLQYDSEYEVVGFTVDEEYLRKPAIFGLPVVPFDRVEHFFPPSDVAMMVSLSFQRMNRLREERFLQARQKGYSLVSYVSSKAVTWPDLSIGENCVISEQTVVHPYVRIGNNVIISTDVAIGHHSVIGDHVFIAPGAVILGGATIGPYCVIAANACVREGIKVASQCLIGMGVSVNRDTEESQVFVARASELLPKPANELRLFGPAD